MRKFIKHVVLSTADRRLPLFIESIGFMPDQRAYHRPDGYPYYHWLQTYEGKGQFCFEDKSFILQQGQGVLIPPGTPHRYEAMTDNWSTLFLTFGGAMVLGLLSSIQLHACNYYRLKNPELFVQAIYSTTNRIQMHTELSSLDLSGDLYQFLLLLKKYGHPDSDPLVTYRSEPLSELLQWMDQVYSNPGIGLAEMAQQLQISKQHLMSIFRKRFGISPYAYLVQMRINKAKECFALTPEVTVKEVAGKVGFNDVSHFVTTFRRLERMTPETFKKMFAL